MRKIKNYALFLSLIIINCIGIKTFATGNNSSLRVLCNVDTSINSIYKFIDSSGLPFNSFLCNVNDTVSGTFSNGHPFKDGDGFTIRLIQGSKVTFSIDPNNCISHPVSLTICDSSNSAIPGAYAPSACPNSFDFEAPYTGTFIVVMNEFGFCIGGGQLPIGEIFCYAQTGSTSSCLPSPPNDSICGALPLTIGGQFYNADNSSSAYYDHDDSVAVAAGYVCLFPNNTLWYSFTAPASEEVTINFSSTATFGLEGWLGVFEAASCTDTLNYTGCFAGSNGNGDTSKILLTVTAGSTYYLMVDGVNDAVGGFSIGIETGPVYPVNDTICGALEIYADSAAIHGNTSFATSTDPLDSIVVAAGFCSVPNNTEWFKFTPAASDSFDLVITADNSGFSSWIASFRTNSSVNSCTSAISMENTGCLTGTNNSGIFNDISINRMYLQSGFTYYFMIDGVSGDTGPFSISVISVEHLLANDTICGARTLILNQTPVQGNLQQAYPEDPMDSVVIAAGFVCSVPNNTEWFSFIPAVSDSFDLFLSANGTGAITYISALASINADPCNGPFTLDTLPCINGTNNSGLTGDTVINRLFLNAGSSYFFMIDADTNVTGSFSIAVNEVVHVGINELSLENIKVYPNPVKNIFNINYNFNQEINTETQLLDVTGRVLIDQNKITSSSETMDVSKVMNGIYFLRVIQGKKIFLIKIVIQH